jgi:hypothetical protein
VINIKIYYKQISYDGLKADTQRTPGIQGDLKQEQMGKFVHFCKKVRNNCQPYTRSDISLTASQKWIKQDKYVNIIFL